MGPLLRLSGVNIEMNCINKSLAGALSNPQINKGINILMLVLNRAVEANGVRRIISGHGYSD